MVFRCNHFFWVRCFLDCEIRYQNFFSLKWLIKALVPSFRKLTLSQLISCLQEYFFFWAFCIENWLDLADEERSDTLCKGNLTLRTNRVVTRERSFRGELLFHPVLPRAYISTRVLLNPIDPVTCALGSKTIKNDDYFSLGSIFISGSYPSWNLTPGWTERVVHS